MKGKIQWNMQKEKGEKQRKRMYLIEGGDSFNHFLCKRSSNPRWSDKNRWFNSLEYYGSNIREQEPF